MPGNQTNRQRLIKELFLKLISLSNHLYDSPCQQYLTAHNCLQTCNNFGIFQCAFLLYLYLPSTMGAQKIYDRVLKPFIKKHKSFLEKQVDRASDTIAKEIDCMLFCRHSFTCHLFTLLLYDSESSQADKNWSTLCYLLLRM